MPVRCPCAGACACGCGKCKTLRNQKTTTRPLHEVVKRRPYRCHGIIIPMWPVAWVWAWGIFVWHVATTSWYASQPTSQPWSSPWSPPLRICLPAFCELVLVLGKP